jgi:hypothetical protein
VDYKPARLNSLIKLIKTLKLKTLREAQMQKPMASPAAYVF